jgi:hypothetical protein
MTRQMMRPGATDEPATPDQVNQAPAASESGDTPAAPDGFAWFRVTPIRGYSVSGPNVVHITRGDHAVCSSRIMVPQRAPAVHATLEQIQRARTVRPCRRCVNRAAGMIPNQTESQERSTVTMTQSRPHRTVFRLPPLRYGPRAAMHTFPLSSIDAMAPMP